MGNKSSLDLTLCFLLMAALCFDAFIIKNRLYRPFVTLNWTQARQYCQKSYIDMVTWKKVDKLWLADFLLGSGVQRVWIGLLRVSYNDKIWKWINLKTGEGVSGYDVSRSITWDDGQQSRHCAFVSETDLMWYSDDCSKKFSFYCSVGHTIHYYQTVRTWFEASVYCHNELGELAIITQNNAHQVDKSGWIGLYQDAGQSWRWIGDLQSSYRNWAPTQPPKLDCASFDPVTQTCHSNACSDELDIICYGDNLVVVNESKTWEEALSHCWNMASPCYSFYTVCIRYTLLSLEYNSQYVYIRDRINKANTTDEIWTGLRFLGGKWWWVDGHKLQDQGMLPDCPSRWRHCGTLSKHNKNEWIIRDCSEKRNFICYRYETLYG